MLNKFCPLSKKKKRKKPPPVLNGQYQNGENTNQNQIKNTYLVHIVFQLEKDS